MTAKQLIPRRVALYVRTSTNAQTTENQERELPALPCATNGMWQRSTGITALVAPKDGINALASTSDAGGHPARRRHDRRMVG